MNTENTPLVSICCQTYNHSAFIRQCLEGLLMQKTSFPFEVLINDDASEDGTADIIREYEKKYPDILKPIYQTENQYSKGVDIGLTYNFSRAQGKYIALCEGDDYWTEPLKLQKQVDFLEANPDFAICFHNVMVKKEEENILVYDHFTYDVPEVTDIYQLAEGNYIHTASVIYRKNTNIIKELSSLEGGMIDYIFHMYHAKQGKIKKLQENMAVYRVHKGGVWSMQEDEHRAQKWLLILKMLILSFKEYDEKISDILKKQYAQSGCYLLSLYRKDAVNKKHEIEDLIKELCEISPYDVCIEMNNRISLLEKCVDKYRNTIFYKGYCILRKLFQGIKS